jgi:hypothetical protein
MVSQHEFGFCFVSGVPTTPEDTEALIRRIGNIRETHCRSCVQDERSKLIVFQMADSGTLPPISSTAIWRIPTSRYRHIRITLIS